MAIWKSKTSGAGTYEVTVTRRDNGCPTTITTQVVIVQDPPTVSVPNSIINLNCLSPEVEISVSSSPDFLYAWSTTNGNLTGAIDSPTTTADQAGTYLVTVTDTSNNCDPGGLTEPAVEYSHSGGACSVTGGYVYRGSAIPALRGAYLYADYCTGQIWMFRWDNGTVSDQQELTSDLQSGGINVASFGQDHDGEVYVVSLGGTIYRVEAE